MSETLATILIVEDEQAIRRFVRTALEAEGFRVYEADGVQRGLLEAATRKPDLVVLDLGLPDGDGQDFIRDLRRWSPIPVIVLSARVDETDKIQVLDAGADDYLIKPFGIGELLALWRDRSRHSADVKRMALEHVAVLRQRIAELQDMVQTVQALADCCAGDERPDCPILQGIEGT